MEIFNIAKVAGVAAKLGHAANVLANISVTSSAISKIGDVAKFSSFVVGNRVNEDALRESGYILDTVGGHQFIRLAGEARPTVAQLTLIDEVPAHLVSGGTGGVTASFRRQSAPVEQPKVVSAGTDVSDDFSMTAPSETFSREAGKMHPLAAANTPEKTD